MIIQRPGPQTVQPMGPVYLSRRLTVVSDRSAPWRLALRVVSGLAGGIVVLLTILVVAALLSGCGPVSPSAGSTSPLHQPAVGPVACVWGRDSECCIRPPRFEVASLRDLRAERFGRVRLAAAGDRP